MARFPIRHHECEGTHYTATADVCTILTYLVEDWKRSSGANDDLYLFAAAILLENVVDTLTVEAIGSSSMEVT